MLFYFIMGIVLGEWYDNDKGLCAFLPGFTGNDGGYDQWYDCEKEESMYLSSSITSSETCATYQDCFIESFGEASDLCVGTYCTWASNGCYCHYIEDPFSATDGCDACKTETPSPTFQGQCDCSTDLGFGIENSTGVCQCDVEFLDGDDCNGGMGSGSFDSGLVAFVDGSCHYDSFTEMYRTITCYNAETLNVDWFSDSDCSTMSDGYAISNNTCYYASGIRESVQPTAAPTLSPVDSEAPSRAPTMTDAPTLSPIVLDNSLCNRTLIFSSLEQSVRNSGDTQMVQDCLTLSETATEAVNIVCGCLGKFSKSIANQYLNCKLKDTYHGLTVWSMCSVSIYTQSCGSLCSGWLRRRTPYMDYNRRRAVSDTTFKLVWSEDVCESMSTSAPTSLPTLDPTSNPTKLPTETENPTRSPTSNPSKLPTETENPTRSPTSNPTKLPTETENPTEYPTPEPSTAPTEYPTEESYPTCLDRAGSTKTSVQCACATTNDICDVGEYCKSDEYPNSCLMTAYTPSDRGESNNGMSSTVSTIMWVAIVLVVCFVLAVCAFKCDYNSLKSEVVIISGEGELAPATPMGEVAHTTPMGEQEITPTRV